MNQKTSYELVAIIMGSLLLAAYAGGGQVSALPAVADNPAQVAANADVQTETSVPRSDSRQAEDLEEDQTINQLPDEPPILNEEPKIEELQPDEEPVEPPKKEKRLPDREKPGFAEKEKLRLASVSNPRQKVVYCEYPMLSKTASRFCQLKELLNKEFPGREVIVTSTMGGRHISPAHRQGKAIDFVIDGLTRWESKKVAALAEYCGFYVYNEYIYSSPYKTGDHMHIEL